MKLCNLISLFNSSSQNFPKNFKDKEQIRRNIKYKKIEEETIREIDVCI